MEPDESYCERNESSLVSGVRSLRTDPTFERARESLHADDVASALPLLDAVAKRGGRGLELKLYATWARLRAANAVDEADFHAVTVVARRALEEGCADGLARLVLAHNALRRGDTQRALSLFRRAAVADASLVDAHRHVRLLQARASSYPPPSGSVRPPPPTGRSLSFWFVIAAVSLSGVVGLTQTLLGH